MGPTDRRWEPIFMERRFKGELLRATGNVPSVPGFSLVISGVSEGRLPVHSTSLH
jgi:hypothetical protein